MRSKPGVQIDAVLPDSPAEKAGLRINDVLLSINSHPLHDVIDFMFFKNSSELSIDYMRNKIRHRVVIAMRNEPDLGLTVKPFKVKNCRNNCFFCFVKQLPRGLRKSLYIKDDDYRLSFLYGNYITLSNLDAKDRKRIIEQRLSPLYVSVHTTNKSLRNRMLGNAKASDIMKELKFFSERKIRIHSQIVLCPGYNDGPELKNTIQDIYKFYPYTSSIAVVPVGLTYHRKIPVSPVDKEHARQTLEIVETFQKRFRKKHGDPVVYCSDEMHLLAEHPFPKFSDYGSFSQIENGVGMIPLFLNQSKKIKVPKSFFQKKKFLTFTGMSFHPYLKRFLARIAEREKIHIGLVPVVNNFFGTSVTVTGLLSGRDVIKALHDNTDSYDILIVPQAVLKEDEDLFIDNVSLKDVEEASGLICVKTDGTPQGLINSITDIH